MYKLEKYGINDNCLSWFKSYLSNRQQVVSCNGELSKFCSLSFGVPQGTILGPTLFVIYVNSPLAEGIPVCMRCTLSYSSYY